MPRASFREPGGAAILRHRFDRPGWVDRAKPCRKTGRRAELPPGQGVSAMRPVRPRRVRRTRYGGAWLASQGRFLFRRGVALTRAIDMNFAFYRRSADVPARRCSKRSASGCGHRFCSSRSLPPQQSFEAEVVDARVSVENDFTRRRAFLVGAAVQCPPGLGRAVQSTGGRLSSLMRLAGAVLQTRLRSRHCRRSC